MTKSNLDRLLENAVAKALGVSMPHKSARRMVPVRRPAENVKHAA
jgi:hypothetical protein